MSPTAVLHLVGGAALVVLALAVASTVHRLRVARSALGRLGGVLTAQARLARSAQEELTFVERRVSAMAGLLEYPLTGDRTENLLHLGVMELAGLLPDWRVTRSVESRAGEWTCLLSIQSGALLDRSGTVLRTDPPGDFRARVEDGKLIRADHPGDARYTSPAVLARLDIGAFGGFGIFDGSAQTSLILVEASRPRALCNRTLDALADVGRVLRSGVQALRSRSDLATLEQRYRSVFHGAQSAMLVCDVDGRIREANTAAGRLFGVLPTFLAGAPIGRFVTYRRQPLGSEVVTVGRPDGSRRRAVLRVSPFGAAEGKLELWELQEWVCAPSESEPGGGRDGR